MFCLIGRERAMIAVDVVVAISVEEIPMSEDARIMSPRGWDHCPRRIGFTTQRKGTATKEDNRR